MSNEVLLDSKALAENEALAYVLESHENIWGSRLRLAGSNAAKTAYQTIRVERLSPALGAEISGVDLTKPLEDKTFQEIHTALIENQVIFFRDQNLSMDQHEAFGRRFGTLHSHPAIPGPEGHPKVLILHADEKAHTAVSAWHADITSDQVPPMGSILLAKVLPETGGDTMFASMYAAYEALTDKWQKFLSDLEAEHSVEHVFGGSKGPNPPSPAVHPVLRTHPVSGRTGLYVNSVYTTKIIGMTSKESAAVLDFLIRHVERPEFHVRFKWKVNSIAFWDNRCTQHRAMADYYPQTRTMQRVAINGEERPFHRPN